MLNCNQGGWKWPKRIESFQSSALSQVYTVPGVHWCSRCTLVLSSSPWTSLRTTWGGTQSSRQTNNNEIDHAAEDQTMVKNDDKLAFSMDFPPSVTCLSSCQFILIFQPEDHEARHFSFDAVIGASGKAVNLEGFKRSNFDFHQTRKKHKL